MATTLIPIKDAEINGVRMTAAQANIALAFARAGYAVTGFAGGAIVLRSRMAARLRARPPIFPVARSAWALGRRRPTG
jgi:hypothetical protein